MTTILVVDDERSIRTTFRSFLGSVGYQVQTAKSAEEALELVKKDNFDIVVSDIVLPRMNGVELLAAIHRCSPETQVIMITGEPTVDSAAATVKEGAFDYLRKPILKDDIVKAVGNAVRLRELSMEKKRLEAENLIYQKDLEKLVKERTEALRESEVRFRELAQMLPQVIFEATLDGSFSFVNQCSLEMFGYSQEDFEEGVNIFQMLTPESVEKARERIPQLLAGKSGLDSEYMALRKDGSSFPVLIYATAIIRESRPVGLRGILIDITQRKQTETVLRESEEKTRALLNATTELVMLLNPDGTIVAANESAGKRFGYPSEELVGLSPFDILYHLSPEVAKRRRKVFREFVAGKKPMRYEDENRGSYFDNSLFPILGDDGDLRLVAVFAQDITERKKIQEALQESEEKYRTLVEKARDGVYILQDKKFVYVNARLCDILGYSQEEIMSVDNVMELVAEESLEFLQKRSDKIRQGETLSSNYDFIGKRKDGGRVYLDINVVDILYDGKPARQGILRDVTRQKLHEQELQNVITNTSHLINTPLTVVFGYLDLVKLGHKEMTPEMVDLFHRKLTDVRELVIQGLSNNITFMKKETSNGLAPVSSEKGRR
jgi:PAS domain S-box-containing protein